MMSFLWFYFIPVFFIPLSLHYWIFSIFVLLKQIFLDLSVCLALKPLLRIMIDLVILGLLILKSLNRLFSAVWLQNRSDIVISDLTSICRFDIMDAHQSVYSIMAAAVSFMFQSIVHGHGTKQ